MAKLILLTPLEGAELDRFVRAFGPIEVLTIVRDRTELESASVDADTTLVSFGTGTIVPATILNRLARPAYNLHPATPEFPGRDPHHHAVYRGATTYGATLHVMAAQVDAGPIVGVERVPVPAGALPELLLRLASEAAMRLIERLGSLLLAPHPLPALIDATWGAIKTRRSDLLRLCRLTSELDHAEFNRRIRAFDVLGYDNLTLQIHGLTFRLDRHAGAEQDEAQPDQANEALRSPARPMSGSSDLIDPRAPISHSRPAIDGTEIDALTRIARTGILVGGGEPRRFARALATVVRREQVFLFSSGRRALTAALASLRLAPGTGVVVQSYVCDAVIWAIREAGLTPQFCDIGDNWVSTPATAAQALTSATGALLLAPPFGLLQSGEPFRQLGLPIIHDLCQASPATIGTATSGQLGDLVVLSFHPTKYLCAAGCGAVVGTEDREVDDLAQASRIDAEVAPVSDLAAAIGSAQIGRLAEFEARRAAIATRYLAVSAKAATRIQNALDVEPGRLLRLPLVTDAKPEEIFARFRMEGIVARSGVDSLAHRKFGLEDDQFAGAVRALATTVSLPFYPALSDIDANRIACVAESLL